MYSVLIGLQVIGLGLIVYSLVYISRGESTYAQKLMIFFMAAELVQNWQKNEKSFEFCLNRLSIYVALALIIKDT